MWLMTSSTAITLLPCNIYKPADPDTVTDEPSTFDSGTCTLLPSSSIKTQMKINHILILQAVEQYEINGSGKLLLRSHLTFIIFFQKFHRISYFLYFLYFDLISSRFYIFYCISSYFLYFRCFWKDNIDFSLFWKFRSYFSYISES